MTLKIVVACGGGIFTTTVVTDKIKDILRKERIKHRVTPAKITEIRNINDADIIVVTGKTQEENKYGIPVMIGMPLFTGMGEEEFTEDFLQKIREISS